MVKQITLTFLLVFIFSLVNAQIDAESNFYIKPKNFKNSYNLVKDFKVDNSFKTDDSNKLQKAIDKLANKGGGRLIIPKGNYSFVQIEMKSNVHIEIDAGTVIRPTDRGGKKSYVIFHFSRRENKPLINTSLVGVNGQFIVDLRYISNKRSRVCNFQNVDGFLLSGMNIQDNRTKFSGIVLNGIKVGNRVYSAKNGVIKNTNIYNTRYGYGLVQMQVGRNILFKNLFGEGGAVLRFESHNKSLRDPRIVDVIDNIVARKISAKHANSAIMLSPHFVNNGVVDIEDVTAYGCGIAIRIESGFTTKEEAALGLKRGKFNAKTSVRDVKAIYTEKGAQLKSKHFKKYMPCDLRNKIKPELDSKDSFTGPSIGVVVYTSNYTVDFKKEYITKAEGFRDSQLLITKKDVIRCQN